MEHEKMNEQPYYFVTMNKQPYDTNFPTVPNRNGAGKYSLLRYS